MSIKQKANQYISKMSPAISGHGGHQTTFNVAVALCHGFALTEEDAWPLLPEYNKRCEPPWSEEELRHKLEDANKLDRHSQPRGYLRKSTNSIHPLPAKPAQPA